MDYYIMFPSDYFDIKKVDDDYLEEYRVAQEIGFNTILINYEELVNGNINVLPKVLSKGICIYRGWMLKPETYEKLYSYLSRQELILINTAKEYSNCHLFPNSYPLLKEFTPKTLAFKVKDAIDCNEIKRAFRRFMIKDYVKSVKGSDFPLYFENTLSDEELLEQIKVFKDLRGDLFTEGIVFKEFVDLKKENNTTNEYRGFYLDGVLLTLTRNSAQSKESRVVPKSLIEQIPVLESRFYTIDFAEKENGEFIVIETGDGQVSGLAENQDIFQFYQRIKIIFEE